MFWKFIYFYIGSKKWQRFLLCVAAENYSHCTFIWYLCVAATAKQWANTLWLYKCDSYLLRISMRANIYYIYINRNGMSSPQMKTRTCILLSVRNSMDMDLAEPDIYFNIELFGWNFHSFWVNVRFCRQPTNKLWFFRMFCKSFRTVWLICLLTVRDRKPNEEWHNALGHICNFRFVWG